MTGESLHLHIYVIVTEPTMIDDSVIKENKNKIKNENVNENENESKGENKEECENGGEGESEVRVGVILSESHRFHVVHPLWTHAD